MVGAVIVPSAATAKLDTVTLAEVNAPVSKAFNSFIIPVVEVSKYIFISLSIGFVSNTAKSIYLPLFI